MLDTVKEFQKRKKADALVVPCWQGKTKAEWAAKEKGIKAPVEAPVALGDFSGKAQETSLIYLEGLPEPRVLLIGLGPRTSCDAEGIRLAYAAATKKARQFKLGSLNVLLPHLPPSTEELLPETLIRGVVDGLLLPNYSFDALKREVLKEEPTRLVHTINLVGLTPKLGEIASQAAAVIEGVNLARDLQNGNADDITPQYLGNLAKQLAKEYDLKATVFDKRRIEKEGMGLLLAVSRGSSREPAVIILEYMGKPDSDEVTLLVGKGVTYDTGGLNLKPTGFMETMKTDMSGAAATLGTMVAAAKLRLPVNLVAIVAATENSIDGASYKPGDVYPSYHGLTVEIGNTDAEGRLTLADALAYGIAKFEPARVIDLATLTGAVVIALGEEIAGMMSNADGLAGTMESAGQAIGERVWRMPLPASYKKLFKSEIADLKNTGKRAGGAITAALFLQAFVGETPWVHLDIAGTAYPDKPVGCYSERATGFGVRLLVEFLQRLS